MIEDYMAARLAVHMMIDDGGACKPTPVASTSLLLTTLRQYSAGSQDPEKDRKPLPLMTKMIRIKIQEVCIGGVGDDVPRVWYWPQRTSATHGVQVSSIPGMQRYLDEAKSSSK